MLNLPIKNLGVLPYSDTLENMLHHIQTGKACELWLLEHPPVYTKGKRSLPEHFRHTNNIPVIPTDRGGQVTYHGPGQLVIYPLLKLASWGLSPIQLVDLLEMSTVQALAKLGITSNGNSEARGVYIAQQKVGSIGLKIKSGYAYHGMAININMDLTPFDAIVPCGDAQMQMTTIKQHTTEHQLFKTIWLDIFLANLFAKRYN